MPLTPPQNSQRKIQKLQLVIKLLSTNPLPKTLCQWLQMKFLSHTLDLKSPTTHIHWEIAITWLYNFQTPTFILESAILMPAPPLPKNLKNQKIQLMVKLLSAIPVPQTLHPVTPRNASVWSPASTVSNSTPSLRNHNKYFKIAPDTKNPRKKLTDAPNNNDPGADYDDTADAPNATKKWCWMKRLQKL